MSKEIRNVEINGQDYYIVGESSARSNSVKVYDDTSNGTRDKEDILVQRRENKSRWLEPIRLGTHEPTALPEMMQNALTEAVQEVEQERLQSQKIDELVDNVKETYEDER